MQSQSDRKLAAALKRQLVNCIGFDGDELSETRKQAYDYYFQRPRGDELAGRSTIVTGDLSSMVEGNLSQMVDALSGKRIAEYCAYGGIDEEAAQAESDCVTDLIFNRQNGFIEITSSIKDAMLLRNCVAKVWVDTKIYKKRINKENVDAAALEDLMQQMKDLDQRVPGVSVDIAIHKVDEQARTASFTVTKTVKQFLVQSLPLENFLTPKDWDKHDLIGIPFCAERHVEPRSALIERGFSKDLVDKLPVYKTKYKADAQARLPSNMSPINVALDRAHEQVEWFECYCLLDSGDGTSELRTVCMGDSKILDNQPSDLICYAAGAIIINPHSFIAISLFDKLKSTQDSSTALTRALMDNLNTTMKNRVAVLDGIVEETDLTDGRTNGAIRVRSGLGISDVRQAVAAFAVPDTSANILSNLEHMRRVRSEMGGASLDMATGQMQLNERIGSMGLDRAYSVMEQLGAFMTKTIAQTLVRTMYIVAHEVLRTQWIGEIHYKRGDTWVTQTPSTWMPRASVKVNLGAPLGERSRQAAVLEKVMAKQESLAGAGMEDVLVNVHNYYAALMQWLRINDIPNPEQYFTDPRSKASIEALTRKSVTAQMDKKQQQALMQQAVALEQLRVGLDKYQGDAELQFKYWAEVMRAQIEEAKLAVSGIVDIRKAMTTSNKPNGADHDTGTEKAASGAAKGESATTGNNGPSAE